MISIHHLRSLIAAATPGPWETNGWRTCGVTAPNSAKTFTDESLHWWGGKFLAETEDPRDAAFIASARTALPEALDEIEKLRALLEEACDIACAQNSFHPDEADRIAAIRKESNE
jgi:hypothetical protein